VQSAGFADEEAADQFLYSGVGGADSPITQEEAAEFQSILRKLPRH